MRGVGLVKGGEQNVYRQPGPHFVNQVRRYLRFYAQGFTQGHDFHHGCASGNHAPHRVHGQAHHHTRSG